MWDFFERMELAGDAPQRTTILSSQDEQLIAASLAKVKASKELLKLPIFELPLSDRRK